MSIRQLVSLMKGREQTDQQIIADFVDQLFPEVGERRSEDRLPFCQPMTLYFEDSPAPVAGLIRDISHRGIGLSHDVPVDLAEAVIRIPDRDGKTLCARILILWCREAARHCYLSGGEFLEVFADDPLARRARQDD